MNTLIPFNLGVYFLGSLPRPIDPEQDQAQISTAAHHIAWFTEPDRSKHLFGSARGAFGSWAVMVVWNIKSLSTDEDQLPLRIETLKQQAVSHLKRHGLAIYKQRTGATRSTKKESVIAALSLVSPLYPSCYDLCEETEELRHELPEFFFDKDELSCVANKTIEASKVFDAGKSDGDSRVGWILQENRFLELYVQLVTLDRFASCPLKINSFGKIFRNLEGCLDSLVDSLKKDPSFSHPLAYSKPLVDACRRSKTVGDGGSETKEDGGSETKADEKTKAEKDLEALKREEAALLLKEEELKGKIEEVKARIVQARHRTKDAEERAKAAEAKLKALEEEEARWVEMEKEYDTRATGVSDRLAAKKKASRGEAYKVVELCGIPDQDVPDEMVKPVTQRLFTFRPGPSRTLRSPPSRPPPSKGKSKISAGRRIATAFHSLASAKK